MPDLSTTYLGFQLRNPLVVSANPLCENLDNLRLIEEVGASAVVLHSLFEEQIEAEANRLDRSLSRGSESYAESISYFPDMVGYNLGPEGYLRHIEKAKTLLKIPVIASLNGVSLGGWVRYAKKMEEAGADALELNIYNIPTDPDVGGDVLEHEYCELVSAIRKITTIPLAVKMHPYFTSIPAIARRLEGAGANGLVMFNRFYQPDMDLENLEVVPHLSLSTSQELLLRLHWTAILHRKIEADLAITGGIHSATDVLKAMMAGAQVAMVTSAILKNGIPYLRHLLKGLKEWMVDHEYKSIAQMQGSMSRVAAGNPAIFERANYMRVLQSYRV